MISRRSPTGTGHPGRQEYRSRSRATLVTLAENFGGVVGDGLAVGLGVGVPAEGDGDAGADEVAGEGGADWVGCDVAVALHAAAARQPTAVATTARMRVTKGELLTCRHPTTDKRTSPHCI